eukprot:9138292-Heterocapsa_arctica.AAC.1
MATKFYWQVYTLPEIRWDIENYNRMNDYSPDRTYLWLRAAVEAALDKWRTDGHRKEYLSSLRIGQPKATAAAAAGTTEVCRQFQTRGTCSFGDSC